MCVTAAICPLQHLVLSAFVLLAILGVQWYLTAVVICIFLITNGVKRLFIYLLAICISSFVKCPFKSFVYFFLKNCAVCLYYWVAEFYAFWAQIFCQKNMLWISSLILWLTIYFLAGVFWWADVLILIKSIFSFFPLWFILCVLSKKSLVHYSQRYSPIFPVFTFTFRSIVHLKFIFVCV